MECDVRLDNMADPEEKFPNETTGNFSELSQENNYEQLKLLGKGGSALVYLVRAKVSHYFCSVFHLHPPPSPSFFSLWFKVN